MNLTPEFNPHEILGVTPDAAPAELKRAYRRLAMRWHPDRNDHPDATERFKAIRAAYDHLTAVEDPNADDEVAADEASPETPVAKAADIRLNLEISLEEGASGCRKTVHYVRGKACATCEGSGEYGMARTRFCGNCHGSGRVRDGKKGLTACEECGGRGFFTERICPACGGSGRDTVDVSLEITVPRGLLPGDELRLAGQGEPGDEAQADGDLFLTIVIRSHGLFQLHGRDLHLEMPISALNLLAGGDIDLPTLAGSIQHSLDAGDANARQLRLVGRGYPRRGKGAAGDLVVLLKPLFPQRLNARQRKLLLQANAALMDEVEQCFPELAAWQSAKVSSSAQEE